MAKITWLGEDDLHSTKGPDGEVMPGAGPSFTIWAGKKFPKDVPVDVTHPAAIEKAKHNRFFKVEGLPGRPPKVKDDGDDKDAG